MARMPNVIDRQHAKRWIGLTQPVRRARRGTMTPAPRLLVSLRSFVTAAHAMRTCAAVFAYGGQAVGRRGVSAESARSFGRLFFLRATR
jgi:hypothetical protein